MNGERLIAALLVGFCGVAAVGSWFSGRAPEDTGGGGRHELGAGLFSHKQEVAVLDIQGMITDGDGGGLGGAGTSGQKLLKDIQRIRDAGAPVVLLNINSPGGSAAASQAVYDELVRLKADKKVKIVATMGDVAASGGYYIACAADTIVANASTLTGSIGVIMHLANYQGLMEKVGVHSLVIKSGKLKDIGSPDRPMTAEERQLLQGIIDDTYAQFLAAVSAGRKLPLAALKPLADGRIFTGRQALKVKIVDALGNRSDAEAEARRLGGLPVNAPIKNYSEEDWQRVFQGLLSSTGIAPLERVLGGKQAMIQAGMLDKVPLALYE